MTEREVREVIAYTMVSYPELKKMTNQDLEHMVRMWTKGLADSNKSDVINAIDRHYLESRFPPHLSDLLRRDVGQGIGMSDDEFRKMYGKKI